MRIIDYIRVESLSTVGFLVETQVKIGYLKKKITQSFTFLHKSVTFSYST